MNIFETLIVDTIYLAFPLLIYLFYVAYNKNINKEENNLIFEFTLLMSFYLIYSFGIGIGSDPILVINMPLILAYVKNKPISAIVLSIIIVIYYNSIFNFGLPYLIIEYVFYFIIYLVINKKHINNIWGINLFMLSKTLFIIFSVVMVTKITTTISLWILISIIVSYAIINILMLILNKGDEILTYHMNIKELEEEKQVRTSLFKITHEIKNPLAVIKGYLDMFDKNNKQHSEKYIPIIKEEVNKTLLLLQDFLYMTKIKTNKDMMDINMLLEETCNTIIPLLKDKKITYDIKLLDDEVYIEGDYNRLMQVLINLIKNSIEAITENGHIEISLVQKTKTINLIIKDNGVGISKEIMDKIEEPFFTTKQNGTGLGVSLSYEIVKQHDGKITYQSVEQKGTTVTVVLPKFS